jgi:hypothetical protein
LLFGVVFSLSLQAPSCGRPGFWRKERHEFPIFSKDPVRSYRNHFHFFFDEAVDRLSQAWRHSHDVWLQNETVFNLESTIDMPMKLQRTSHLATVALIAWLSLSGNSIAAGNETGDAAANASSQEALDAASERIRQTGAQIKADIAAMRETRRQRAALEAKQEAERRKEAERAREQAQKDAAQLAAAKEAKQRQSIEAALAQARKEAEERAAKAERERQAAIDANRALEEKLAKELAAKEKAYEEAGGNKLGQDLNFGVDI